MYFQLCFPQQFSWWRVFCQQLHCFMTDGKHSILLFNQVFFSLFWRSNLSLCLWYNKEALSDLVVFRTTCSQRSKILFCSHYSHNWTITSVIILSVLVSRHSYRNVIDFSWHLQSMSICLVMAVNICFDATLDPAAQRLPHEPHSQKVRSISLCQCAQILHF